MTETVSNASTALAPKLIITRHQAAAQSFTETLAEGIDLEMVLIQGSTLFAGMSAVGENAPNGVFMMGSPDDEVDRYDDKGPQHEVTVPTFFMGKFPVTQAQWRVVAETYPQVDRNLDPDPANFKGANRPVEQVSWWDAVEFCTRLSRQTGRTYRLPSEAEWEYACRAGTTMPFHFGETITTDLANYDGTHDEGGAYGWGPKGIYRKETTDVGSLGNANAFGLYDMHGNVWEWCLDHWHDNYEGEPPTDGSAWVFPGEERSGDRRRVLRGGSWSSSFRPIVARPVASTTFRARAPTATVFALCVRWRGLLSALPYSAFALFPFFFSLSWARSASKFFVIFQAC